MTSLAGATDPAVIERVLDTFHGELAFDVGANGGSVARRLARHFARVVAFEPCAESFADLARDLPDRITAVPQALSDEAGTVTLSETVSGSAHGELVTGDSLRYSWGDPTGERQVEATTLDAAAARFGTPDFVKIDTEGHELRVVLGGMDLLQAGVTEVLIEVHAEGNGPRIMDLLPNLTWQTFRHPGYEPGSYGWANHFYLIGTP